MLEAQSRGLIDYSTFDIRESTAHIREAAVLHFVLDQLVADVMSLHHDRELALLGLAPSMQEADKAKERHADNASKVFRDIGRAKMPWIDWPETSEHTIDNREILELQHRWETAFGALNNPEVQELLKNYKKNEFDASKLPPSAKLIRKY